MSARRASSRPVASPNGKRRLLLVDDDALVRSMVPRVLNQERDLIVCDTAASASQALDAVARLRPDLVLVDVILSGRDGFDLVRDLRSRHPKLPSLVISVHEHHSYAERALRAGANGYVRKNAGVPVILEAIRRVLSGRKFLEPAHAEAVAIHLVSPTAEEVESETGQLTDRELQVYRLMGEGRKTRQIALLMKLSEKTIESHEANMKRKLRCESLLQLARRACLWVHNQPNKMKCVLAVLFPEAVASFSSEC